jgi:hypothetical protein
MSEVKFRVKIKSPTAFIKGTQTRWLHFLAIMNICLEKISGLILSVADYINLDEIYFINPFTASCENAMSL